MSYSLLKEDDKAFHLMHEDGQSFQVAKKGLDEAMHGKIRKMVPQHMSEGGVVQDPTEALLKDRENTLNDIYSAMSSKAPLSPSAPQLDPQNLQARLNNTYGTQATPNLGDVANLFVKSKSEPGLEAPPLTTNVDQSNGTPDLTKQVDSESVPFAPANPPAPAKGPSAGGDSYGLMATTQGQLQGINEKAKAEAKRAEDDAEALDAYNTSMAIQAAQAETTHANFLKNHDQYLAEFNNAKLDPNRVWNTMGTGNKVLAGIGLILGGLGAGASGGPNLALQVIDKAIDNDIDAQKNEILKKKDLIGENQQGLRSFLDWEANQRSVKLAAVNSMIQQNAAMSGSPIALANAKIASNEIKQKVGEAARQYTMQAMALQSADPITAKISLLLPKEDHAKAYEELGNITEAKKAINNANNIFDNFERLQTLQGALGDPTQHHKEVEVLNSQLLSAAMKGVDVKRFPSPEAIKVAIEPYQIKISDSDKTAKFKKAQFIKFLRSNAPATPILSGRGWVSTDTGPVAFHKE